MKKLFICILAIISLCVPQTTFAEGHWGLVAGVNFSNLHFKQNLFSQKMGVGATVGIKGDLPLGGIGLGVDAALLYSQLGGVCNLSEKELWRAQGFDNMRIMTHNIEIPIHVRYIYQNMQGFENTLAPFVYVGPSFAFNVGGNCSAFSYPGMSVALQFGLGLRLLKKFDISAQYDLGATYCMKDKTLSDFSAQNRAWRINFVWYFK